MKNLVALLSKRSNENAISNFEQFALSKAAMHKIKGGDGDEGDPYGSGIIWDPIEDPDEGGN